MEISLSLPSGEVVNWWTLLVFEWRKEEKSKRSQRKESGVAGGRQFQQLGITINHPHIGGSFVEGRKEGRTMKDRASAWNVNSSSSSACHRGVINCKLYYVVNISWSSHNRCLMLQLTTTKPRPRIMWGITSNWTNRGRIPMDGRELAGWMKNRAHQHRICWTFIKFICAGGWSSYFSQSTGN